MEELPVVQRGVHYLNVDGVLLTFPEARAVANGRVTVQELADRKRISGERGFPKR